MVITVKPQFYVPAFCIFTILHTFCTVLASVHKTNVVWILSFLGGSHKNIILEFYYYYHYYCHHHHQCCCCCHLHILNKKWKQASQKMYYNFTTLHCHILENSILYNTHLYGCIRKEMDRQTEISNRVKKAQFCSSGIIKGF